MDRRNFLKIGALAVAVGAVKVVPSVGAGAGMGPAVAAATEGAGGLRLDLAAEPTSEGGVLTLLRVHNGTDSAVEQGTELHLVARSLDEAGLVGGASAWEPSDALASSTQPGEGRWAIALPEAVAPGEAAEVPLTWTYAGGSGLGSSGTTGRVQVFASLVVESDPYHEVQSPEVLVEV
ncbi:MULTISPECIES: hypothetical protein [unclassified Corynebacterium]|uniref:hypothetical protein n=1 Tax=unclassified Corynebacterium TaxID=2624378 RepID=UPI0029CA32BF|nr:MULTISPECIES: hypothetical protein [unclassified Corynebacterium]WPF65904.1 hypothetical protein OLX12_10165 [Corynebacterium sp. 22KM0430]WPF68397.1 hypothetical protein OLW90_10160 [Corynebacterium sp. 21KM1197]